MNLRHTLLAAALGGLLSAAATAGEILPFTPHTYEALVQAGKPVVIDVAAGWCPTCRAQKPILERLVQQPAYRDLTLLTVDFDEQRQTVRRFKVRQQSTLVALRGDKELGRSVGDTTEAGLARLLDQAVR